MNPGVIPGQGPRSHRPRLRVRVPPLRPGSDKLIKINIKKMRENDSEPGYLLQGGMIFWEHHSFQQVTREGLRKI